MEMMSRQRSELMKLFWMSWQKNPGYQGLIFFLAASIDMPILPLWIDNKIIGHCFTIIHYWCNRPCKKRYFRNRPRWMKACWWVNSKRYGMTDMPMPGYFYSWWSLYRRKTYLCWTFFFEWIFMVKFVETFLSPSWSKHSLNTIRLGIVV